MYWKTLFSVSALALAVAGLCTSPQYKSDEILVKFKASKQGASPLVHAMLRTRVMRAIPKINVERVKLPRGMSVPQALQAFKRNPAVEYAEPNYFEYLRLVPNDPDYGQQPHLAVVHLPEAWDFTTGTGLIIAVIDNGVDYSHPDLAANTIPGKDWIDGDSDPSPGPGDVHGTHVAGIAAAVTNNGVGVAGSGWDSKIMGIRFDFTLAGSADSMIWAADNGANIVNMSYGYYGPPTATESAAVDYAFGKGVLLVGAAGNANTNTLDSYPDGYEKVISVGATENNDTKASFSDWGPRVDVAAPGVNIYSTLPDDSYGLESGTSMASPLTCGVAAIVWSQAGPGYTNADIRALLEDTSVDVGTWLVHGRVDAKNAIDSIGTPTPFSYTPTSIDIFEGTWLSGGLSELANSDDAYFQIKSGEIPQVATVASAYAQIEMDRDLNGLKDLKLNVEVSGLDRSTLMIFLWDWTRNTWVSYKQFPMANVDKEITLDFDKYISKWLNNNRQMRVLLRDIGPNNRVYRGHAPPFTFNIDRIAIDTVYIVN